jgi:hypothetical protein
MMEAASKGKLKGMAGPSISVAKDFLNETPEKSKSIFAKQNKFSSALKKKRK